MAVHYSKYSAVLEVEKAMLGIELGRIGELLMKANKDRRNLQQRLSSMSRSTSEEIGRLQRELREKVGLIRPID
jgi:hypothetical protein